MWWRHKQVVHGVWVAEAVLHTLVAEAAERAPLETGGMLLGYHGTDGADAVVTSLVGAGPSAQHELDGFVPDGVWQQTQLERIYEESGRVTTFLGDWHSHPRSAPLPSRRDNRTARKVARARDARAPFPLTIIAGRIGEDWSIAAFQLMGRSLRAARIRHF
jgi:integrative and conjugative element protein (TIGR02256 family)